MNVESSPMDKSKKAPTSKQPCEGELEHVYDAIGTFISFKSSGSGYGTKSLYERWNETKDDPYDSYDDDDEYNACDLTEDQLAFCDAWDTMIREEIFSQELKLEFSEDEKSLITRMYKLVGERWSLIAGRIPGRTADEIKEYWTSRFSTSD
ncbi:Myb-like transcription factor ETC1 isoform X1 [Tanacetum coccineum]